MAKTRPLRVSLLLLCLEGSALVYALCVLLSGGAALEYAQSNQASDVYRAVLAFAPLGAGLLLGALTWLWVRRRPARAPLLELVARRAAPVLALWPVPLLARRGVFEGSPLMLVGCIASCVWGLERALAGGQWRWQSPAWAARERVRRRAPRVLMSLAVLGMFSFAYVYSVRVHHKLLTSNYDFGLFENLFYNALHGRPGLALGARYFVQHAEFLLYVLLPFYALVPRSETLLALQSGLVVGAALPLYLLAERWLKSGWAALVLALVYLLSPAVHGPLLFDFHFLPLCAFFIAWAAYFYALRRWLPFWIAVCLALLCREDVAIGVAAMGFGLLVCGRTKKTAWALLGVGVVWFFAIKFIWMRTFGATQSFVDFYDALLPAGEAGFGGVIKTLLSNPLYTLGQIAGTDKLLLGLQLLAPLAFVPLRQRGTWFFFLPGFIVIGLATSWPAITQVHFHYAMHLLPYLCIATVIGLAVRPACERWPLLWAMLLGAALITVHFGAFMRQSFKTSFHEVSLTWDWQDAERREEFARLAEQIPPQASVSAGEYEGPQLARRERLFALKQGIFKAEFVIYSRASLRWGGAAPLRQTLAKGEYGLVDKRSDFTLLARGVSTARNQRVLAELAGFQ